MLGIPRDRCPGPSRISVSDKLVGSLSNAFNGYQKNPPAVKTTGASPLPLSERVVFQREPLLGWPLVKNNVSAQ